MLFFRHLTLLRLTCGLDLRPHMQMTLFGVKVWFFIFVLFLDSHVQGCREEGGNSSISCEWGALLPTCPSRWFQACRHQQHSSVCVGVGGQSCPQAPAHPCVLLQQRAPAVHPCIWKRPMPVALSLGAAGARMWRQVPGSGGLTDGMPHRCFWKLL